MFENHNKKARKKRVFLSLLIVFAIIVGIYIAPWFLGKQEKQASVLTTTTLKEIIDISEISTLQAIYDGIAEVKNEKNPGQTDYYVSYKAQVNAGFDFKEVKITIKEEAKLITVTIPNIKITDINVDISSLDYMFYDNKADKSTVSAQAYRACIEDAEYENRKTLAIYYFAEENAKNAMEALLNPFIRQLHSEYELEIVMEGTR